MSSIRVKPRCRCVDFSRTRRETASPKAAGAGAKAFSLPDNAGMQKKWPLNLLTALVWAIAGASAVYWGLRLAAASVPVTPETALVAQSGNIATRQASMARLLGAQAAEASSPATGAGERFTLAGVVASAAGEGVALISADGKPARPYAIGTQIAPGYVLKSVGRREAMLAGGVDGPVNMTLALPAQRNAAAALPPSTAPLTPAGTVGAPPSIVSPAVSPASPPKGPATGAAILPGTGVQTQPDIRGAPHGPQ